VRGEWDSEVGTRVELLKKWGLASCPAHSENLIGLIDDLRFMIYEFRSMKNPLNKPSALEAQLSRWGGTTPS
jgi:hypothetical protein